MKLIDCKKYDHVWIKNISKYVNEKDLIDCVGKLKLNYIKSLKYIEIDIADTEIFSHNNTYWCFIPDYGVFQEIDKNTECWLENPEK